jgi:hypothetical protein
MQIFKLQQQKIQPTIFGPSDDPMRLLQTSHLEPSNAAATDWHNLMFLRMLHNIA